MQNLGNSTSIFKVCDNILTWKSRSAIYNTTLHYDVCVLSKWKNLLYHLNIKLRHFEIIKKWKILSEKLYHCEIIKKWNNWSEYLCAKQNKKLSKLFDLYWDTHEKRIRTKKKVWNDFYKITSNFIVHHKYLDLFKRIFCHIILKYENQESIVV
mgnify:CR=1 FL=1